MSGACVDEYRRGVLGRWPRWRVQRVRSSVGAARAARDADCRLYRELLHAEKFMGRGLGRQRLLLRSEERTDGIRSGVHRGAFEETVRRNPTSAPLVGTRKP